jgi:hypothetical protein
VSAPTWDTERAAERARTAYRFVAMTYPPDESLWTSTRTPLWRRRPPATSTLTKMRSGR